MPAGDGGLERLLAGVRRGDARALERVVGQFGQLIVAVGLGCGLSWVELEDLAQITWGVLFDRAGEIREPARLGAWLGVVARREAVRLVAGRLRGLDGGFEVVGQGDAVSGDELERAVRRLDAARAVGPAVLRLPAAQQRLVAFVLMCPEASYQEISGRLEMPMGSIGPIMGRAFSTLRRELARVGFPVLVVVLVGIQEGTGFDVGALVV